MDLNEKESEKNNDNVESNIRESSNIEPIETIQSSSSFKGNSNYDKRKNYQTNHHKPNHFNNYGNHPYYQNNYANQNTMSKNRKGSIKYSNYIKTSNIDNKNKNYNTFRKKKNQEIDHNNDHNNSTINDNKLVFINSYKEAEDLNFYKSEFSKIGNLNFLKQNWKQKRFPEEENNDLMGGLGLNLFGNLINQSLNNINYSSLLKQNFNQGINSFNLGNNQINYLQLKNFLNNYKQNNNNFPKNVSSPNKVLKGNTNIMNSMLNYPINPMNLNNANNINNLANLSNKINPINNLNPLSNINNIAMLYNHLNNNNKYKNIPLHQNQPNNQVPATNNHTSENTTNKSPQKINHINNNIPNQISNSFNSLLHFYFNTLQYQQIILSKMAQLFSKNNNNVNIHTDIQNTISQLKTMLNNEMNQLSPILSQNTNQNQNNLNTNNNINNTQNINTTTNNNSIKNKADENNENINNNIKDNEKEKENEKNNDKYIQNILSTWPKQKFVKPYSPLLKLEKSQSLKTSNLIYNPLNTNNTLNINTMTYSNLNINQNYLLNNEQDYNKQIEINYSEQKIEELLKIGKCLTGVIRMNKSQSHGYITVPGINNDILVRGKNLYDCLNLDEVVVELFNFSQWKSLANKKTRKFSHVNEEGLLNNVTNSLYGDDNKNQKSKSLDEEEENLKTKEERTNYINKQLYDLRPEGKIIKIIKSPNKEKEQICTIQIQIEKNKILALPIDENIPKILINVRNLTKKANPNIENMSYKYNSMYYLPHEFEKDYNNYKKKYFRIKIYSFASSNFHKGPLGYILNEIGESGDIEVETTVLLNQNNVLYEDKFSDEIMKEVKNKLEEIKITEEYIQKTKRKDFRNELVFTIDPYTSKDLDDAIHVKIIDEKTKMLEIGVHIADPTTYVEEDSLLDKEALFRGTSVYLVQKKISMLPLILSEDVCSIMPKKETLTISCIFRINLKDGKLDEDYTYFCPSVVNSRAKWDYDLVQKIIEKKDVKYEDLNFEDGSKPDTEDIFKNLVNSVDILYNLTKIVRHARFESGSLMIDNDDIYFDLDKQTNEPKNFHISIKNESHNLIEELMLISNYLCAKHIYKNLKNYALIRRHPFFNDSKFNDIQRYFSLNKMNPPVYDDPTEINKLLIKTKKENYNKYLCIQHKLKFFILRAEYIFAENKGQDELKHSSLNLDLYTHFTSPIRRYPDFIVHRQLKEIFKFESKEVDASDFVKFEKYAPSIDHINERYNSARLISQKSKRLFQCLYLKTAPKKLYTALIMDIISKNPIKKGVNNTGGNNTTNNSNYLSNNNVEEEDFYLVLFVPELNLELEWRVTDNEEIICSKPDKIKNELYIDYMIDKECKNKYLRTFDALQVELFSVDSIPIDVKCKIDFTK